MSKDLVTTYNRIAPMTDTAINKVRKLEAEMLKMEQLPIVHHHVLHGGMYARSIMIPSGALLTGVLIKVATILIISGHVKVFKGGTTEELIGYNILPASAHRKGAFLALSDTFMTMLFPTKAETVAEAEEEFTDEYERLTSRLEGAINPTIITGE